MRDLACCADGMAFYSTPSDLVRFALATKAGRVVAHVNTTALAPSVADVFPEQK